MGVKTTVYLTRKQAESRYADFLLAEIRKSIEATAIFVPNSELEDKLEMFNDAAHDGEGFENYIIKED